MRRRTVALIVMAGIAGGGAACSSSAAPAPTFLGTWQVRVTSFSPDSIEPNPFNVTLSGAQGDTLHISMPAVQWDHSPNYVFDSVSTNVIPTRDSITFFEKDPTDGYFLAVLATSNTAHDTATGQIGVLDAGFHVIGGGTVVLTKH